jgi:hypothetical protein
MKMKKMILKTVMINKKIRHKKIGGDTRMSYQINIFNMDINYCSKDGNININRTIRKNNYLKDKDNTTNSSTANIQKQ